MIGSITRVTSCLLVAGCLSPVLGQEKKDSVAARQLPGAGVADPVGKIGYFPNTSGGIDAIDLTTGKVLWTNKDANRPLLATADRLFAQKKATIVVMDTAKEGKTTLTSKAIAWPDWVSVDTAYGRSFRSSARLDGKDLFLTWDARAFYAGGARPTPQIEKAARKESVGVAKLDQAGNGKIELLDADKVAAGNFLPMPNPNVDSKVGTLTLQIKDAAVKNAKNPFERRRTLQAVNDAKDLVWERDIAAPVFLPPRP